MAGIVGAVAGAVKEVAGQVAGAVQLPEGKWVDAGPACDLPCLISGLCPCSCIATYMTWTKLMPDEAQKQALIVCCGYCIGLIISIVFSVIDSVVQAGGILALIGGFFILIGQAVALVLERKKLGEWLNIPEEKRAEPAAMACACCCCCFQMSQESKSVDEWLSTTMLMGPALMAAHEANKALKAVAGP